MSERTPTPWHYQENSDAYTHIVRSGDRFIFQLSQDTSGEAEASARFIVKAVNSHEALVEAIVHYSTTYCEGWCKDSPENAHFDDCGGCKARNALASIKETAR